MTISRKLIKQVLVKGLMKKDLPAVGSNMSLQEACEIMCDRHLSCLVVTDNDYPVGIITERDIVRILMSFLDRASNKELQLNNRRLQLNSFMTTSPLTVHESEAIVDAMALIRNRKIRHLPVVDNDGKLSGLLSYSYIVRNEQQLVGKLAESFEAHTDELKTVNDELRLLSLKDPLLGIGNRRAMETDIIQAHDIALRYGRSYSMALVDIDLFKKYNDHYGHTKGDEALKQVSDYMQQSLRTADRVYRYGGEEFLLLLPETSQEGAIISAQRLISGLAELVLPHSQSPYGYISISLGLVTADPNQSKNVPWQQLIEQADKALYIAKQEGRNQFAVAEAEDLSCSNNSAVA